MQADCLYMIRGASTANSPFFETKEDCKLFLKFADRFLKKFMKITRFQNNRDGWVMLVATRSPVEIKSAYFARRANSDKCKKEFEYKEVWQMLSDQIRIFLSTFVKASNYRTGRTGGKVRRRFERYIFDDEAEAQAMCKLLEQQYYQQEQPVKRYRPAKKLHSFGKKLIRKSIYICCYLLHLPKKRRELGMECLDLSVMDSNVARHLINRTINLHIPHFQPT